MQFFQSRRKSITLIGKKGYSPAEQLSCGQASKCSDLYSLAATAMVLLTDKQPDELYDSRQGQWDWNQVQVSFGLKKILSKMLAERPSDRYQSVEQIRQAFVANENDFLCQSFMSRLRTLILASGDLENRSSFSRSSSFSAAMATGISQITQTIKLPRAINYRRIKPWHWGMIAAGVVIIPGLISFVFINHRITGSIALDFDQSFINPNLNQNELNLQRKIHRRVKSLSLDASDFYTQVDNIFHARYPELVGVKLTPKDEHQEYRNIWYQIANSLLSKQERSR